MVLRRGGGHWSRLLPSETFDKSCLAALLKTYKPWCQSTLASVSLYRWWMVVATGSLTFLALVQVVLVWEKLCLVGGSTWALACAAGQLVCLSTFSALWNVPKLDTWAPGQVGDRHHRLQVHRPPFHPFFKAAAAVQKLHHRWWNQWREGLWFSDTTSDSQSRDTSAWSSIATCFTCWME